jgi:hypothetical protein
LCFLDRVQTNVFEETLQHNYDRKSLA